MSEKQERDLDLKTRETFGQYLQRKTIQRQYETGKILRQVDMAEWIGVPLTSFNQWWNDFRLPRGVNVDLIADKLGIEVYEHLGIPERMPRDPRLLEIVRAYYAADEKGKSRIVQEVGEALEGSKSGETPQGAMVYVTE